MSRALALACLQIATFAAVLPAADPVPIAGRVLDERGLPLFAAAVELWPFEARARVVFGPRLRSSPVVAGTTGEDGVFSLEAPPGLWRIVIRSHGRLSMETALLPAVGAIRLPQVVLLPAQPFRVVVEDPLGGRLTEATVVAGTASTIWGSAEAAGWTPVPRSAVTDARGEASLGRAVGERVRVRAFAPGLAPSPLVESQGRTVVAVLGDAHRLVVEVADRSGPLAGASVRLGPGWPVGETSPDGRLLVALAPGRRSALEVVYASRRLRRVLESPAETVSPLAVALPPAKVTLGAVVTADGTPIPGALVWNRLDPVQLTRTDRAGQWRLEVADSVGRLAIAAPGYVGTEIALAGAPQGVGDVVLQPSAALGGRVVDEAGRGVPGARVGSVALPGARAESLLVAHQLVASSLDGRFHLGGLAAGVGYELHVEAVGYAPRKGLVAYPKAAAGGSSAPIRVVLSPVRTVSGQVVDLDDRPVVGATVAVLAADPPEEERSGRAISTHERRTTSDDGGAFLLSELPGGFYHLVVEHPEYAPAAVPSLRVAGGTGDVFVGSIVLQEGERVEGTVLDPEGEPLAAAVVSARLRSSIVAGREGGASAVRTRHSDSEGRFSFPHLAAGAILDLEVQHALGEAVSLGVRAPARVRLRLRTHHRLAGQVVDRDGAAIPGARLSIHPPRIAGTGDGASRLSVSDPRGRFDLSPVPAGLVELRVAAEGFQPAVLRALEVPGDGELEVVLIPAATLEGRVFGAAGRPLPGAVVELSPALGEAAYLARTDGEGRYRVEGLASGRHAVRTAASGFPELLGEVDVAPGRNRRDWTLRTGVALEVRLLSHRGEAVADGHLSLIALEGPPQTLEASTDAAGRAQFPAVADGSFRVDLQSPFGALPEPAVEIRVEGEAIAIELVLEPPLSVRGRVLGLEFDDLAGLEVWAFHPTAGRRRGRLGFDGTFVVEGLAAGRWQVGGELGGRVVEEAVRLEEGVEPAPVELDFGGGHSVVGRVTLDSEPLSGVGVLLRAAGSTDGSNARTDSDGVFRLDRIRPGHYRVTLIEPSIGLRATASLEVDGELVRSFDFGAGSVAGRVESLGSGRSLPGTTVSLFGIGLPAAPLVTRITATDGGFALPRLVAGAYLLRIEHPEHRAVERQVTVRAGGPPVEIQVVLEPLLRRDGSPMPP